MVASLIASPSALIAACPTNASRSASSCPWRCATACSTLTACAVTSGPIPSPPSTAMTYLLMPLSSRHRRPLGLRRSLGVPLGRLSRPQVPSRLTASNAYRYSTGAGPPSARVDRMAAGERHMRDRARQRALASAKSRRATPGELREAGKRLKELEQELQQLQLLPETKHGEEREQRYERLLRIRGMREEFQGDRPLEETTPSKSLL